MSNGKSITINTLHLTFNECKNMYILFLMQDNEILADQKFYYRNHNLMKLC